MIIYYFLGKVLMFAIPCSSAKEKFHEFIIQNTLSYMLFKTKESGLGLYNYAPVLLRKYSLTYLPNT